jgi:4-hydroxythreonine-4-phosphate dehydrogenase
MRASPRLAITAGEPAGVGPELVAALAQSALDAELVAIADPDLLGDAARRRGLALALKPFDPTRPAAARAPGELAVLPVPLPVPVAPGRLERAAGPYVVETLRRASAGCLDGTFDALVTAPVHKGAINDAGIPFTGHTELLAELAGADVVMLLATPGLRVALVTTHLPLRAVPDAITPALVERTLRIVERDLRARFGVARPRIAVLGLNPHAGEAGHLGREEIEVIVPVLERLRAEGFAVDGPLPADTAFVPARRARHDAFVAMYHDQGLPVLKAEGFGAAVNVTLGLPYVRTSVDHGTALDIAGTGQADASSLIAAAQLALELCRPRARADA